MPALPSKISRRKGGTPVARADTEDMWKRTLEAMGLEPLNVQRRPQTAEMGTTDETKELSSTITARMSFRDLPVETRRHIFKLVSFNSVSRVALIPPQVSRSDLISLSLVSKHFRDLAAEQMYRKFDIVFPDEDDSSNEPPPIDSLAVGLETFATSDYNYAQYLKEIIIDTLNSGDKAERAYRYYMFDQSSGKFMNTLLLLTLRKARALETFRFVLEPDK